MNLGSMSTATSSGVWKSADGISDQFPAGLRVLVVDDDPICLMILERMLRACLYEVTKSNRAEIALKLLRENRSGFDIVISDVHMPDMDGFKLLEHIGLEMDLPVIMMSADDGKNVVMKGVTHGACDYLIKPVRIEALKNIWQHVIRKRKNECKELEQSGSVEDGDRQEKPLEDADYSSSANEGSWKSSKRRKDEEDEGDDRDDSSTLKKPRVVWSVELHQQFVAAVNHLGIDKAVPKKILEMMNVPGLTRENVASHLQKYRLYLRRLSGVSQHQNGVNSSFISPQEANFGTLSSLNRLDLQGFAVNGQLPAESLATLQAGFGRATTESGMPMSLVDQRNVFSFEYPNLRFGEGQHQQLNNNGKQINLLHGIPTTMEPKQFANLRQSSQSFGSINMQANVTGTQNNSLMMRMAQSQIRGQIVNDTTAGHVSGLSSSIGQPILSNGIAGGLAGRNGIADSRMAGYHPVLQTNSMLNFPVNSSIEMACGGFPLGSTPGMTNIASKGSFHEDANLEIKGTGGYMQNYDIFNNLNQNKSNNWDLQSIGMTFDASQHAKSLRGNLDVSTSGLVNQVFSSSQTSEQMRSPLVGGSAIFSNMEGTQHRNTQQSGQQFNTPVAGKSIRVKSEGVPDASYKISGSLFSDQFGQEDLMSAILRQQEGIGPAEPEFDFDDYSMDHIHV